MVTLELSTDDAEFLCNLLKKYKYRCQRNITDFEKVRPDRIMGPYGITTEETLHNIQESIEVLDRILGQF